MTTSGGNADTKRGVWMEKVNRGRNTEEERGQIRRRMDFKNLMQLRFPELRIEVSTRRKQWPFAGTHD